MTESIVLAVFAAMLVFGIAAGVPIVWILVAGFVLFAGYALKQGHSLGEVAHMAGSGMKSVRDVLILYLIVGMMCAAWRASGTIPYTVSVCAGLMTPPIFILMTFLACCLMSTLMGTSTGTAATMGVICMTIASAMGADKVLTGGAILAGSFFGDRMSPMSGSALLVAGLTKTEVRQNVLRMAKTAAVPFALACLIYAAFGFTTQHASSMPQMAQIFARSFHMGWVLAIPALAIVVLSLLRVSVKKTMLASLVLACIICVAVQGVAPQDLPGLLVFGYTSSDRTVAAMLDGGGVLSMMNVASIILVSSTYSGIFDGTGLLRGVCTKVWELSRRSTPFLGVLVTSFIANCMACNQTLSIMLTDQICRPTEGTGTALALDLENSAVVLAGIIPWSLSCVAVLSFIGAPSTSVAFACFLYLLPLWTLFLSYEVHHDRNFVEKKPGQLLGLTTDDVAQPQQLPLAA
ncbi:MAG: Na+/H+ antiporter NhaC family protein [Atopobiaceae bacterium]